MIQGAVFATRPYRLLLAVLLLRVGSHLGGVTAAFAAAQPLPPIASPAVIQFPPTLVRTQAGTPSVRVRISNPPGSPAALTISSVTSSAPAEFGVAPQGCTGAGAIPAGGSCQLDVIFNPLAIGPRSALITISDNATTPTLALAANGTGLAPVAALSTTILMFTAPASGPQGNPGVSRLPVRVTNTGTAPLNISQLFTSGASAG
jgi:hypothetical protein